MALRVDHVASALVDASAGPTQSIPALCNGQVAAGLDVHLHTLEELPPLGYEFKFKHVSHPWVRFPHWALCRSPDLYQTLRRLANEETVIHYHSLWQLPNIYPGWMLKGRNRKCRLVCSPRGCLTSYSMSQSRWKKRIMWQLGQKRALVACDMFHATCEREVEDIRRLGFRQPVVLLPNGITVPGLSISRQSHRTSLSNPKMPNGQHNTSTRTLIYISRIHPEKRIDLLLDAWKILVKKHVDWELKVYGPVYDDFALAMKAKGEAMPRCRFMGEVTGDAKWLAYHTAELFILPTRTENFGMAIAEALACGTPVITTKGAPWEGLSINRCGWWIDDALETVIETLDEAMAKPEVELEMMGSQGREWMKRDFDWGALGIKMKAAYEWLMTPEKFDQPKWVIS